MRAEKHVEFHQHPDPENRPADEKKREETFDEVVHGLAPNSTMRRFLSRACP